MSFRFRTEEEYEAEEKKSIEHGMASLLKIIERVLFTQRAEAVCYFSISRIRMCRLVEVINTISSTVQSYMANAENYEGWICTQNGIKCINCATGVNKSNVDGLLSSLPECLQIRIERVHNITNW